MTLWHNGLTRATWTKTDGGAANPDSITYNILMGGVGALRDVRLYARALPGAEIAAIKAATDLRQLPAHRWKLEGDGKDTGTADALVDVTIAGQVAAGSGARPGVGEVRAPASGVATFDPDGFMKLDGDGDYIDLGSEFTFAATDGFTWCAWVRYDAQGEDDDAYLLSLKGSGDGMYNNIQLSVYKGTRRAKFFITRQLTGTHGIVTPGDPSQGFFQETEGSWAHLGATASLEGGVTLWRDGETRTSTICNIDGECNGWTNNDNPENVSVEPDNVVYMDSFMGVTTAHGDPQPPSFLFVPMIKKGYFAGALRDVRLYARALPGAELAAIATTTDHRDANNAYKEATRAASCQYSIQGSQCTAPELAAAVSRRHDDGECELEV
jgi:hypothetical protein